MSCGFGNTKKEPMSVKLTGFQSKPPSNKGTNHHPTPPLNDSKLMHCDKYKVIS